MRTDERTDVPAALWLWAPLLWLPFQFGVAAITREGHQTVFSGEFGIVEVLTAALLWPAAYWAVRAARPFFAERQRTPAVLLCVFAFGCVFLFAEEVSYGQHLFAWGTPDYFAENNAQLETNLHNLDYVNKSVPKWIVIAGMTMGAIVLPLMRRRGRVPRWTQAAWVRPLLPTIACLPTAAVALAAHLAVKVVAKGAGFRFEDVSGVRLSETVELYIAFFFALYAYEVYRAQRVGMAEGRRREAVA